MNQPLHCMSYVSIIITSRMRRTLTSEIKWYPRTVTALLIVANHCIVGSINGWPYSNGQAYGIYTCYCMCPYENHHPTYQHLFNSHYLKAITGHLAVISHTVRVQQKDRSSHNSYGQLCKRDTKRHILLCICMFYVLFQKLPNFYMVIYGTKH